MENLQKILRNNFKLSGFNVRSEFISYIIEKLSESNLDLNDKNVLESCVQNFSSTFDKHCPNGKSIEKEHVQQALDIFLESSYDKDETIFNVINAFDFPRLRYDSDRKQHFLNENKPKLLPDADGKGYLFLERYSTILQRVKRIFQNLPKDEKIELQTVDYLLTSSSILLEKTVILGCLVQLTEGKYYLEDPTGIVELNLKNAKYGDGFFVESSFVLARGSYEDKLLTVSHVIQPFSEPYKDSRVCFGNLNYFGGKSATPLRDSTNLYKHLQNNSNDLIMIFSDVHLDNPSIMDQFRTLFTGLSAHPPIAFIFIGNFLSQSYGSETISVLKNHFKQLADLLSDEYSNLISNSRFVFVPGPDDPCPTNVLPRFALPEIIRQEMRKKLHDSAIFTTNPARIQYCNREIVILRTDLISKFLQGALHRTPKSSIIKNLTETLISQGHLSPLSLNALTINWDYDYTMHLYPLPDLVIVADRFEAFDSEKCGCKIVNPGPFCNNGFQFKAYTPTTNGLDDCVL